MLPWDDGAQGSVGTPQLVLARPVGVVGHLSNNVTRGGAAFASASIHYVTLGLLIDLSGPQSPCRQCRVSRTFFLLLPKDSWCLLLGRAGAVGLCPLSLLAYGPLPFTPEITEALGRTGQTQTRVCLGQAHSQALGHEGGQGTQASGPLCRYAHGRHPLPTCLPPCLATKYSLECGERRESPAVLQGQPGPRPTRQV